MESPRFSQVYEVSDYSTVSESWNHKQDHYHSLVSTARSARPGRRDGLEASRKELRPSGKLIDRVGEVRFSQGL